MLEFPLTSLFCADNEKEMESPRLEENTRGKCGRKMQAVQGGPSASCLEAAREIHGKARKRLKLDREHREGEKSWT